MELLRGFGDFSYPNEIGPGVYDIHSPRVPARDEMLRLMRKAAAVIPPRDLWVKSRLRLKTRGWPEVEAGAAPHGGGGARACASPDAGRVIRAAAVPRGRADGFTRRRQEAPSRRRRTGGRRRSCERGERRCRGRAHSPTGPPALAPRPRPGAAQRVGISSAGVAAPDGAGRPGGAMAVMFCASLPFGPSTRSKLTRLPCFRGAEAVHLDRREVREDVFATSSGSMKPKPFRVVEPLDGASGHDVLPACSPTNSILRRPPGHCQGSVLERRNQASGAPETWPEWSRRHVTL
jgi:hypothetical protein